MVHQTYDALGHVTSSTAYASPVILGNYSAIKVYTQADLDTAVSGAITTNPQNRTTLEGYDVVGRLAIVRDPERGVTFNFYDSASRVAYTVNAAGEVTGFGYNADGQKTSRTLYANTVSAAAMATWFTTTVNTAPTPNGLNIVKTSFVVDTTSHSGVDLVTDSVHDRTTSFTYDGIGRVDTEKDAANVVTHFSYDTASRLIAQTVGDRTSRYIYNPLGEQVGVIDGEGYLTEQNTTTRASPHPPYATAAAPR